MAKEMIEELKVSDVAKPEAVSSLGVVAAKHLAIYGEVSFYVENEAVRLAMPGELTLDALPEPMAINDLSSSGKTDEEIEAYLRGRDARLRNRHGKPVL